MIFFYGVDAQKRIFVADADIDIREFEKKKIWRDIISIP